MEKTIEQRAREVFPSTGLNDPTWERRGYIKGATDQQKIDDEEQADALFIQRQMLIEKACEWLDHYMDNEVCAGNHSRQYADILLEAFKQAMEHDNKD